MESNNTQNGFGIADILYLTDIKRLRLLPYKTNTSIKKFLKQYHAPVFGKARKYVFKVQFIRACLEARISDLKREYGSNWLDALKSNMNLHSEHKSIIEVLQMEKESGLTVLENSSDAKNKIEQRFLLDIDNALKLTSSQ